MYALEAQELTKQFGSLIAVDHISFHLKEGEILGLLGQNGAGKTTTIQMLVGVLTQTSGTVYYFGKEFEKNREEILDQVNFSSTYTNLPQQLTVKENLTFVSYLYSIQNRKARIDKLVEIFNLGPLLKQRIYQLSAGQTTRVNLAKAMINYPRVLLLDEPTASLDVDVAHHIRNFLLKQQKEFKVSIILTSHNMAEVEEVCDRIVFIHHGRIIADNTPYNLAKSISVCHVGFYIHDGMKRIIQLCKGEGLKYSSDARYITVDMNDGEIAQFLRTMMQKGIDYDEISIDKPRLEDYFLAVTSKNVNPREGNV